MYTGMTLSTYLLPRSTYSQVHTIKFDLSGKILQFNFALPILVYYSITSMLFYPLLHQTLAVLVTYTMGNLLLLRATAILYLKSCRLFLFWPRVANSGAPLATGPR